MNEQRQQLMIRTVDQAAALQAEVTRLTADLDMLKVTLRELAEVGPGDTKRVLAGTGGHKAEVVYVSDAAKLDKTVNLAALETTLGTDAFRHLFVTEVKLAPDFLARVEHLPAKDRRAALAAIRVEPREPRVSVK